MSLGGFPLDLKFPLTSRKHARVCQGIIFILLLFCTVLHIKQTQKEMISNLTFALVGDERESFVDMHHSVVAFFYGRDLSSGFTINAFVALLVFVR